MTNKYDGKVLFTIFIEQTNELPIALKMIGEEVFPPTVSAKANAETNFTPDFQVEQVGFYYDDSTDKPRGVLTGVAAGSDLVEITENGRPQLIGMEGDESKFVQGIMASIVKHIRLGEPPITLGEPPITWLLTVLEPLDNGNGPLYIGGMGGIQGGDDPD